MPGEREKFKVDKPIETVWSWEVGIFANITEIGKWIDHHAMICESGDMSSLYNWKAALRQFYRNIKSLLISPIRETAEKSFEEIDFLIDATSGSLPRSREEIRKIMTILGNLNDMLYEARNELWIKTKMRRNVEQELRDYMIPKEAGERKGDLSSQP